MANSFVNKKADLTSNSATTLYTVPSYSTAVIKSILVSEDSGNADTITVTLTDTSIMYSAFLRQNQYRQTPQQSCYQHP